MTKFKIISWILLFLLAAHFACIYFYADMIYRSEYDPSIPRMPIKGFCLGIFGLLISSAGLYCIQRSCAVFVKRSYFNSKSAFYLTIGGYILGTKAILSGIWILSTIYDLPENSHLVSDKYFRAISELTSGISYNLLLLIVGFAIIAVADIIKKGENIKLENDLTI